jgi:hypothetical protein
MPHAVFVRKRSFQHITEDFHIAVGVRAKAPARSDAIFVDDAQAAKSHVLRIMIIGKRKSMTRIEPPMLCVASLLTSANCNHAALPHIVKFDPIEAFLSYIVDIEHEL